VTIDARRWTLTTRFQFRPARILYRCDKKKHLIFHGCQPLPADVPGKFAPGRKPWPGQEAYRISQKPWGLRLASRQQQALSNPTSEKFTKPMCPVAR
jgi:hypothetical protein